MRTRYIDISIYRLVGEHSQRIEGYGVSRAGALGRENVGISNRNSDEIIGAPKV